MPHGNSIEAALRAYVDAGALAGAATLVWRHGRVVHTAILGCRDLVTNLPVERDTIFRIASMTKPLTTVAALMLYDEGRFALDEPIARHAPEFADLRVLRNPNGPLDQTDAAERPITFGDLLTHRSGLTYGEFHRGPIARACAEALGRTIDNGGWWQADPTDNSVLIFLAHNMLELQQMASGIGVGAWSAIAKFHELASA